MGTWGRVVVGLVLLGVAFVLANAWRSAHVPPPSSVTAVVAAASTPVPPAEDGFSMASSNAAQAAPMQRMEVAFRLDRDITAGHYLGERWVSPPTFNFAQPGKEYVTHAKLQQVADDGTRIDLSGDWSTNDPEMIAISRDQPGQVTIVVREPGQAQLVASAGGVRKVLQVTATRLPDAMEVAFVQ
jgi:hypothetical protein